MSPDDFEEIPDEAVPGGLQKKWDNEDFESEVLEKNFKPCPHCGKFIEPRTFSCFYCGERVFWDSGLLGNIRKNLAQKKTVLYIFLLAVIVVLILKLVEL